MGINFKILKKLLFYSENFLRFFPVLAVPRLQLEGVLDLPFPVGCSAKFAQEFFIDRSIGPIVV